MSLAQSQQQVAGFVALHGLEAPVEARVLDLSSEVGELAKEALKGSGYGRRAFEPTADWAGELGDALFALLALANSTGVSMEQALEETLAKYEPRLGARQDAGSGR